jgi:hypothetical protein
MSIRPRTALKNYPDLAQQIGLIVAEYALLEQLMLVVYASLSGKTPLESFAAYFELRKSHLRKELVLNAAQQTIQPDHYKALFRLWRRFAKAADRRTEIAHVAYIEQSGKMLRLQSVGTVVKFIPLTPDYFERTFSQYHNLGTDLLTFAALIAGSTENCQKVVRSLPLSPGFDTRQWVDDPHPPDQSLLDQTAASLSRLGLAHVIAH